MTSHEETILNEINGYIRWSLLHCAIEMRLFDYLCHWTGAEEIAARMDTDHGKTELFLSGLTACGYLHKFCGRYVNTHTTALYLVSSGDLYQGHLFLSMSQMRLQGMDQLSTLLKPCEKPGFHLKAEDVWVRAWEHLLDFQKSIAPNLLSRIHALEGISGYRRLLDLGGGPGHVGISILQAFPVMTGVLFDLPGVVEKTSAHIAAMNMSKRFSPLAGDYNHDSLGRDYDLVIAGRSLYYAKNLDRLMDKIAGAMNHNATLLCMHEGLYNEKTAPAEVVLGRIGVALRGSDVSFERGEIEGAMERAGIGIRALHNLNAFGGNTDLIIGVKP